MLPIVKDLVKILMTVTDIKNFTTLKSEICQDFVKTL